MMFCFIFGGNCNEKHILCSESYNIFPLYKILILKETDFSQQDSFKSTQIQ